MTATDLSFKDWLRALGGLGERSVWLYDVSARRLAKAAAYGQEAFSEEVWSVKSRPLYKTVWRRYCSYLRGVREAALARTYEALRWESQAPPAIPYSKRWLLALEQLALSNHGKALGLPEILDLRFADVQQLPDRVVSGEAGWIGEDLVAWRLLQRECWPDRGRKAGRQDLCLPRVPGGILPLRPRQVWEAIMRTHEEKRS